MTRQLIVVNSNAGIPGSVWRTGADVPSNSLGVNGDYFLRSTNGDVYLKASNVYSVVANIRGGGSVVSITYTIDNNGSELDPGFQGYLEVPFACTISKVTLLSENTGSIVIDIWKAPYADFPLTAADSIVAAAKPTINNGIKYQDSVLTGWTTNVSIGDILGFNIDSVTDITNILISLTVTKV